MGKHSLFQPLGSPHKGWRKGEYLVSGDVNFLLRK